MPPIGLPLTGFSRNGILGCGKSDIGAQFGEREDSHSLNRTQVGTESWAGADQLGAFGKKNGGAEAPPFLIRGMK
jgi:hypothetical protein